MPQYQGIWTLAQAAQLQSTQRWATDPLFENTTLLLQADNAANGAQNNTFLDSSSNNFTITRNGNTTQGTFTPFSATGWSNYFDGSGDYLSIPDNAAFSLGSGEFSIECFVYPSSTISALKYLVSQATSSSGAGSWTLYVTSGGLPSFYSTTNGTTGTQNILTSSATLPINQWSHVCVCRSGTTLSLFLNGTRVATQTYSSTIFDSSLNVTVNCDSAGTLGIDGYLSNVRIVKGSSAYSASSSTITAPTAPLTAITNTSLLTCQSNRFVDNSSNNFTITRNGDTSVQAFSPFAPQYQYTPSVTGGSGYFDGTGDWLSVADSAQFNLGTSNYTMEFWVYPTSFSAQVVPFAYQWSSGGGTRLIAFAQNTNGTYLVYYYDASNGFTSTNAVTLNAWNHVALVRNSNTFTLYINGVSGATNTTAITYPDSPYPVYIGASYDGTTGVAPYFGYISNVRVVNGTAVYTSNFTPPTAPLTAITNTSLLCNFTNAGIYDGTLKNNLETVGNAQVSTSVVKYGTGSMAFDGSLDWLTTPLISHPAYLFQSTADWTLEFWFYTGVTSGTMGLVDTYYTNSAPYSGLVVQIINGTINVYDGGSNRATTTTYANNTWQHFAWVNSNGTSRVYMNGVNVVIGGVTSWATSSNIYRANAPIQVGRDYQPAYFNGYIDDLRITKFARYTANFTPPSVALPRQ